MVRYSLKGRSYALNCTLPLVFLQLMFLEQNILIRSTRCKQNCEMIDFIILVRLQYISKKGDNLTIARYSLKGRPYAFNGTLPLLALLFFHPEWCS